MRRLRPDLALGVGLTAFALVLLLVLIPHGISRPGTIRVAVLSPTFWPNIIGWGILIGGLALVLQNLAKRGAPAAESTDAERLEPEPEAGSAQPWLRLGALAVMMAAYFVLLDRLGMVIASTLAFLTVAAIVRARRRLAVALTAVLLPLAVYAFFNHVAGVPIPQGRLLRLP